MLQFFVESLELFLRPLALGYVANHYTQRLTTTVSDQVRANLDVDQRTVLATVTPLTADVAPSLQHALDVTVHAFARVRYKVVKR